MDKLKTSLRLNCLIFKFHLLRFRLYCSYWISEAELQSLNQLGRLRYAFWIKIDPQEAHLGNYQGRQYFLKRKAKSLESIDRLAASIKLLLAEVSEIGKEVEDAIRTLN